MMASARAPAQWPLTNTETIDSFERWRQNLLHHLSFDTSFSHMLKAGYKWETPTETEPYRGFKDDGDTVTTNRMTASQKSALLELMLGEIANYCPVIARNIIVKKSTSLDDIWHTIRMHFGFQKSGVHFCDYLDIMSEPNESPEDLFQRMTAFINDNLMSKEQPITHHGVKPTKDEEFSPTLENLVFLRWLYLLHPHLPSLVKQRYASDLRSKTLASLKAEISASLDSLLRELETTKEVNNKDMPLQSSFAFEIDTHASRNKSCPICKQALRRKYDHCLLKCPYLPEQDRRFLTRKVPIFNEFEETSKLEGTATQSAGENVEDSNDQFPSTSQVIESILQAAKSQRTQERHLREKESEEDAQDENSDSEEYESAVEELEDDDEKAMKNGTKDESSDSEEYETAVEELDNDEEYGFTWKIDDDDEVKISAQGNQDPSDSQSEKYSHRRLLRPLQKMGFDRRQKSEIIRKSAIIIFDSKSKHLQRFDPKKKTLTRVHEFNGEMKRCNSFASVSIGDYIYVLMDYLSMYRLKYCDVTATWERMEKLICYHGYRAPAVVVSGSIIIAGGSLPTSTQSVTKYDPSLDRWERLKDKNLSTRDSANVASGEFVYCIGGSIDDELVTSRVDRLNVLSKCWNFVASLREARYHASAFAFRDNLFVAGGRDHDKRLINSVEKYDPIMNQWTIMKPMSTIRYKFRCHLLEGCIYAVGSEDNAIERYDAKDVWKVVEIPGRDNLRIRESVLVEMMM